MASESTSQNYLSPIVTKFLDLIRFAFSYAFQGDLGQEKAVPPFGKLTSRIIDPRSSAEVEANSEIYFWVDKLQDSTMELQIESEIWHWFEGSVLECSSGLEMKGILKELDAKLLYHDLRPLRIGIHFSAIGGCRCLYLTKDGYSHYCLDVVGEASPFAKAQLQSLQLVKKELL